MLSTMSDAVARLNAALEGRYRIESELGEGGMATVYLAADLKHERKVALKVLKPELAAVVGADRFLAEIKTTANLQHPHILPLFDSGEADSFLFYVMPYVEGESLRERLDREHQLPVDEAVRIASDVAEALQYAHDHEVIHRDIKPANILIQAGRPVISDFGIALAVGVAGGGRLTETGLSVGTPHYMSPEQATGDQTVGPPTDIYALGCALFEMLVGEPPFTGSTPQAILGKIIAGKLASATEERASVPANVDAAIRKALEKLPADRFTGAQEFAKALADLGFRHGAVPSGGGTREHTWNRLTVVFATLAVVLGGLYARSALGPDSPVPVSRFTLDVQDRGYQVGISHDGSKFITSRPGGAPLLMRDRSDLRWTPIAGTEGALNFAISPDGTEIAFNLGSSSPLRVVSLVGAPTRTVADSSVNRVVWGDDGFLYFQYRPDWSVYRVPAQGGPNERVTMPPPDLLTAYLPVAALPGGHGLLIRVAGGEEASLGLVDLDSNEHRVLFSEVSGGCYARSGHVIYTTTSGSLMVASLDAETLEVGMSTQLHTGSSGPCVVSMDGTMLYRQSVAEELSAQWRDSNGSRILVSPELTDLSFERARSLLNPRISPDGTRLALQLLDVAPENPRVALWIQPLQGGPLMQIPSDTGNVELIGWSAGSDSVLYVSGTGRQQSVWSRRADGIGGPTRLFEDPRRIMSPMVSRSGWILYVSDDGVRAHQAGSGAAGRVLFSSETELFSPALSPDGRWLAYMEWDGANRGRVYLRPFPDVDAGRWLVPGEDSSSPRWASDSRTLYFESGGADRSLMSVQVSQGPEPIGAESRLFSLDAMDYDVHPDGERFITIGSPDGASRSSWIVVQNFFEELKRLVPN